MTVYLVGAGPGDPGLLTRRAGELLTEAEVVVVDRLVDRRVLALAAPGALVIEAGKHGHDPAASVSQDDINALLLEHGLAGRSVVRLKGGDPFLLGRGGEELDLLRRAGVEVEVVPGVSSALAVPALVDVPVTHRGVSQAVTIASGHSGTSGVDWAAHAASGATLVLLMAVASRGEIAEALVAGGLPDSTPVRCVESGSTPEQRQVSTTLAELGATMLRAPAVIVVGEVAGLDLGGLSEATASVTTGASAPPREGH